MGSATCLNTNQACWNLGEKLQNFTSPTLTFNDDIPDTIDAVHLKNVLAKSSPIVAIGSMAGSPHLSVSKMTTLPTKLKGWGRPPDHLYRLCARSPFRRQNRSQKSSDCPSARP
jgi:hypothetical protein